MDWKLGLNFYSSRPMLFDPKDLSLDEVKKVIASDKYHIYLVCKRKKQFFVSSEVDGPDHSKTAFYSLDSNHEKVFLGYRHPSDLKINSFKDGIFNIDFKEQKDISIRDFILLNSFGFMEDDLMGTSVADPIPSDLEVMYIGQAFGRNKIRKIDYRIEKHEKIQQVALNILGSGSNEEVLVIGLCVEVSDLVTSIVTIGSNTEPPTLPQLNNLQKKASERIAEAQALHVFEASLIRYFQPALNTEYKETFPQTGNVSYDEIYDTSFDYVAMTLDTRPAGVRVYSQFAPERKYLHMQHYPLRTRSEKKTLFEYLYEFTEITDGA